MTFGRKPIVLIDLETDPNVKVSVSYKEYYELLNKTLAYFRVIVSFQDEEIFYAKGKGNSSNISQETWHTSYHY